ncbi:MAG: hypothetical protein KY469_15385 [Actinobacteria bacterium]|nr:hypothetical protein [Actinomycetota bacterium]
MTRRRGAFSAGLLVALALGAEVAFILDSGLAAGENGGPPAFVESIPGVLGFGLVGAYLVWRRPDHRVSWLVAGVGLFESMAAYLIVGANWWQARGGSGAGAYLLNVSGDIAVEIGLVLGLVLLPVLFPTGEVPSRRWRWLPPTALTLVAVSEAIMVVLPDVREIAGVEVANPLGIAALRAPLELAGGLTFGLTLLLVVPAAASLVVRFRRARGTERLQLRWFVAAVLVLVTVAVTLLVWALAANAGLIAEASELTFDLIVLVPVTAMPVAIGAAVLRYRLYEVDRVISRTVSYGLLTGVLVGVYALGVLGVGAFLPGEPSDLLVAGSTLVVAALFRPLRSRIQTIVDRRFNRSRYDARRTIEAFGARLRHEVDLDEVANDLRSAAAESLQPRAVSLWLPPAEVRP